MYDLTFNIIANGIVSFEISNGDPTLDFTVESGESTLNFEVESGLPGEPGFSPTISVEEVQDGHIVHITDVEGEKSFEVLNGSSGTSFETDETLSLENGVLSVNRATTVEEDNTLPITSAAVATVVGNIDILLSTI